MNQAFKWLLAALISVAATAATAASSVTIDKMYTGTFGGYTQYYTPGGSFMLFSQADYYLLSDGSTWDSGAGWHPDMYTTLAGVKVVGDNILYLFNQPSDGILFQNTDYSFGDHSAQGVLATPDHLVMFAKLGSTKAVMLGYTTILSNDETWYGDLFNHYSAPVGSSVFFAQTYTLQGSTFSTNLFDTSFTYNESGFVDFTHVRTPPVPEPQTYALMLGGLAVLGWLAMRRRRA